jgi:ribonuclease P protein component
MDGLFCPAAVRGAARSSPSVPKGSRIAGFPKSVRLLRSKDFRRVYDHGARYSCPFFAAFYARRRTDAEGPSPGGASPVTGGPRIGFTIPRSVGRAVVRNRIKRRVREAIRQRLDQLSPQWEIVFNPRRAAMESPLPELIREVEKLFLRCNNS